MKTLALIILTCNLFAFTSPDHNWTGQLKNCALSSLKKKSDYNITKEALETITTFDCSYSGTISIEPIQDLANVEVLRMRRNNAVSALVQHFDESNDTSIVLDDNDTPMSDIWLSKVVSMFPDVNETIFTNFNDSNQSIFEYLWGAKQVNEYDYNSTQEIPAWIGDLTHLKKLDLSGNSLEGKIPTEITTLSLEKLNLSNNHLTALPDGIENMTTLKELDVSHNDLIQPFPSGIAQLTNLEKLYLQENRLHGVVPDLSGLTKLKRLRLNGNNLRMTVTYDMVDVNLSEPSGFAFHKNCRIELPADNNETNETNETAVAMQWVNDKSSIGFDGIQDSSGKCSTPAMVPIIMYLLTDTNDTNQS